MDLSSLTFSDPSPWPPIEVFDRNPQYGAAMLSNIGSCNSEMSAISLYIYNSMITRSYFFDIAECFHRIGISEMHHLNAFGELALQAGADPRLWSIRKNGSLQYWSPACNRYPTRIGAVVSNSLDAELEAIKKYQSQTQWIKDRKINAVLNRVIADEVCHVQIFRLILAELNEEPFAYSAEFQGEEVHGADIDGFYHAT